jgi:DUF1680 family protein
MPSTMSGAKVWVSPSDRHMVNCGIITTKKGSIIPVSTVEKTVSRSFQRSREKLNAAADGPELPLTAVPYFAWSNRAAGPMLTWVKRAGGR